MREHLKCVLLPLSLPLARSSSLFLES